MKLAIVTSNKHKLEELRSILEGTPFELINIKPNESEVPKETGKTFVENAKIKALYYAKAYNIPVISDDSGLVVPSLYDLPGLYSSRYSGLGDIGNNLKLLKSLEGKTDRYAYFNCTICIAFPDLKTFVFEGKFEGAIGYSMDGSDGFGYDPIFIPKGESQSLAVLGSVYKRINSHRAAALKKFLEGKDEIINYWRYTWQK
ncbi:RdgB/HAM1 family non-canonical purine NTP pyrophosphatase [Acholeplasma equirhinis]|uniref:RdgB/HAM1 family non-canonical purine NTP pyrophosphatase n=1 Tax=Acholeplasma equirhinis TaxID=555393 RepID=UPI00197ACFE7|nr:RdgB/HAM1 family non-canonical purine NTP pyrophosphatase [Acholeplasma equirhinis]MBN3490556.1 RdgB/HAM1 family non-canonical purine NTP pyrophosphatase [Acholeplasma equirhinis]